MRDAVLDRWKWLVAAAASAAAAMVLFAFNPMQVGWYPRCVLFLATGIYCPGCGALRAGHALLHGHFLEALDYNPVLVAALPFLAYVLTGRAVEAVSGRRLLPRPELPARAIYGIFALMVVFTVLRNLPYPPFTVLAP